MSKTRFAGVLLGLAAALGWPSAAVAHEVPSDVTVEIIVRPAGERLNVLVRAPLEAMQDIEFPTFGPGYLDTPRAAAALRNAALLWLGNDLELYEAGRRLPLELVAARASIPSDRSFTDYERAVAHVRAPPLAAGIQLVWQQALLDAAFEAPIRSATARFAIRPGLERLGRRVVTIVRFEPPDGVVRVYRIEGDTGMVELDPRWHRALLRFLTQGFEHILDGADHLLFLVCLVVPFRQRWLPLLGVVTAFTVGHSATLIASAYGAAPAALWFPPLIETLIAASILYMAVENALIAGEPTERTVRMRWLVALAFGLVHGFGFSFVLRDTLQFAGSHLVTALLGFNVGIELGQLLVLALLIPLLNVVFATAVGPRAGTLLLSLLVGHVAWHWMVERFAALRQFESLASAIERSPVVWIFGGAFIAATVGLALRGRRVRSTRAG